MYENLLCRAIDLLADNNEKDGTALIQECISQAKNNIQSQKNISEAYYYWGMSLNLLEEYQQAILKFERVLDNEEFYEKALWQIVYILFYNLGKAQTARKVLEEKLVKMFPDNKEYKNTLEDVKVYLAHAVKPDG